MDESLVPYIYGSIMLVGVVYMVVSLIFGDLIESSFDVDLDLDLNDDSGLGDVLGISLGGLAAFCAAFGAMGVVGMSLGASFAGSLIGALIFGLLVGRLAGSAIGYLKRHEVTSITSEHQFIGKEARITINTAAGKVGEAMVETEQRFKYPVKEVNGMPLQRGDRVEIVDVAKGVLYVRQKDEVQVVQST